MVDAPRGGGAEDAIGWLVLGRVVEGVPRSEGNGK
jgi:hypothetical protein